MRGNTEGREADCLSLHFQKRPDCRSDFFRLLKQGCRVLRFSRSTRLCFVVAHQLGVRAVAHVYASYSGGGKTESQGRIFRFPTGFLPFRGITTDGKREKVLLSVRFFSIHSENV